MPTMTTIFNRKDAELLKDIIANHPEMTITDDYNPHSAFVHLHITYKNDCELWINGYTFGQYWYNYKTTEIALKKV